MPFGRGAVLSNSDFLKNQLGKREKFGGDKSAQKKSGYKRIHDKCAEELPGVKDYKNEMSRNVLQCAS